MRQFHNLEEYFNVEMSVPWLMKYCPHQIYELDLIFHISSFTRGLGNFLSNSPTILFPSSCLYCLVTSCLGGCLCSVYSFVSLVIGAGADMSLGDDGQCHHPIPQPPHCHWAAPVSHSLLFPPRCCGQFRSGL